MFMSIKQSDWNVKKQQYTLNIHNIHFNELI